MTMIKNYKILGKGNIYTNENQFKVLNFNESLHQESNNVKIFLKDIIDKNANNNSINFSEQRKTVNLKTQRLSKLSKIQTPKRKTVSNYNIIDLNKNKKVSTKEIEISDSYQIKGNSNIGEKKISSDCLRENYDEIDIKHTNLISKLNENKSVYSEKNDFEKDIKIKNNSEKIGINDIPHNFNKLRKFKKSTFQDKKRNLRKTDKIHKNEHIKNDSTKSFPSYYLISKESIFMRFWGLWITIISLYSVIMSSLNLAFYEINEITDIMDICFDYFFLIDLIINFFVPFLNLEDELIFSHKLIALNYIKGWFIIDLISSIPSGTIIYLLRHIYYKGKNKYIYIFLRITRLLKFIEMYLERIGLFISLDYIDKLNLSSSKKRIFSFSFTFIISTHILSCIWILIAKNNPENNWILFFFEEYRNNYTIYIASLYFIWTTLFTVGYGDIYPVNNIERIFSILLMMFGILIYSYTVSSLGSMLTTFDILTTRYYDNLYILNELRQKYPEIGEEEIQNKENNKNLFQKRENNEKILTNDKQQKMTKDENLYIKLINYLNYDYNSNRFEKLNFIQELPFKIRSELIYNMYENIINLFPFFKFSSGINLNNSFNAKVILSIKQIRMIKDEYIINEGEIVEEMFLVNSGILIAQLGVKYNYQNLMFLRKYDHFGEVMMLSNKKSEIAVRIKSKTVELFLIKKKDLYEISLEYPEIFAQIYKVGKLNNIKLINLIEYKKMKFDREKQLKILNQAMILKCKTEVIEKPSKRIVLLNLNEKDSNDNLQIQGSELNISDINSNIEINEKKMKIDQNILKFKKNQINSEQVLDFSNFKFISKNDKHEFSPFFNLNDKERSYINQENINKGKDDLRNSIFESKNKNFTYCSRLNETKNNSPDSKMHQSTNITGKSNKEENDSIKIKKEIENNHNLITKFDPGEKNENSNYKLNDFKKCILKENLTKYSKKFRVNQNEKEKTMMKKLDDLYKLLQSCSKTNRF